MSSGEAVIGAPVAAAAKRLYRAGEAVEARWEEDYHYYPATISHVNWDGTYDVCFVGDKGEERSVAPSRVRRPGEQEGEGGSSSGGGLQPPLLCSSSSLLLPDIPTPLLPSVVPVKNEELPPREVSSTSSTSSSKCRAVG